MGGQFQLLQKCHCCYFQHLPKFNFSSVTSSSGSVGSSGVAVLLSPIWDTPAQHPLRSPGLPHPALLRGAPYLLQTAQKIAKQDPFLLNQQQKATELHRDGNGPYCGFWLCSHFQQAAQVHWQQKPADTLNYAKVVFREIVITNILSQSSRH